MVSTHDDASVSAFDARSTDRSSATRTLVADCTGAELVEKLVVFVFVVIAVVGLISLSSALQGALLGP